MSYRIRTMLSRASKWFRAILFMPRTLIRLEESISIYKEHSIINTNRILHRIDELSRYISKVSSPNSANAVQTLYQHSILKQRIEESSEKSYSQYGDDIVIGWIFGALGIRNPSYIDVGAHHPTHLNNTARLYERGASGINIEANPELLKAFAAERPRDVNLNCGIGTERGQKELFVVDGDPTLSTFDPEQVKRLKRKGSRIGKTVSVDIIPLQSVIDTYCNGKAPDFLSVDVEGMDYIVLTSIDLSICRPKVICIEINSYDRLSRMIEIEFHLFSKDYFHFGDIGGWHDGRNAIFVDLSLYKDLAALKLSMLEGTAEH